MEMFHLGIFPLELVVNKMCHDPARLFKIENRGFIKKGYKADIVLVDMDSPVEVNKSNVLYKCGWSSMEGFTFRSKVVTTFVNGNIAFNKGSIVEEIRGERLTFNR